MTHQCIYLEIPLRKCIQLETNKAVVFYPKSFSRSGQLVILSQVPRWVK